MIEQLLTHRGHTRRFVIEHVQTGGWEVKEELDSQVLSKARYHDWHRVEQAVQMKVSSLQRDGWNVQLSA